MEVPLIDIFAGPGGLSEGFSRFASFSNSDIRFVSRLAIEKDPVAVETLRLRSFFRQFRVEDVPDDYYRFLRQQAPESALWSLPEWKTASDHVWNAELGVIEEAVLHEKIASRLNNAKTWVLLGGPPCQAYSLMGRARMTGLGNAGRDANLATTKLDEIKQQIATRWESDKRHFLYQEYLRIVAVHQPSVFVMENVMGILSAMLPEKDGQKNRRAFDQIKKDLSDPWAALEDDPKGKQLAGFLKGERHTYRLHSFVVARDAENDEVEDRDYLIRSDLFGVPQKRNRVILLGVRDDINAMPGVLKPADPVSVKQAIGGMPELRSGLSREDSSHDNWRNAIEEAHNLIFEGKKSPISKELTQLTYLSVELGRGTAFMFTDSEQLTIETPPLVRWLSDARLQGIPQHESRSHMPSDLVRYLFVSSYAAKNGLSPRIDEWPIELLPKHKNISVEKKTGEITAEGFNDRFKVQRWNEPSSTVTSHIAKDGHFFIHPDPMQCRSLTVREAARLQTFPDNYYFCGNRTQQYHQIGNAVPPYLAVQLAKVVADLISNAGEPAEPE